jgi:hypothetical protein
MGIESGRISRTAWDARCPASDKTDRWALKSPDEIFPPGLPRLVDPGGWGAICF